MLWVKVITEMCPDTLYFVILRLGLYLQKGDLSSTEG